MDDLDLISDFEREFPGPDATETARVWGAVAPRLAAPRAGLRRPTACRPGLRRRWLYAAVAAGVAIAAVLIIPAIIPSGSGPRGGPQTAAAEVLNKAAAVAAGRQAPAAPGAGQYVYTKTRALWEQDTYGAGPKHDRSFAVLLLVTREAWIGTDGSGRLLETTGTPTFLSEKDKTAWKAAGSPKLGADKTADESYGKGGLPSIDLSKVPTDVGQLRAMIEQRKIEGGPAGNAETFTIIGDLLRETYASPALRAALYEVAAQLPGVELIGTVKDAAGRTGAAVAYTSHGTRHELIFDPRTSALLGERYVVVNPTEAQQPVAAGTVMGYAVYLDSGVVNSTRVRP